jgi:hypothetical protein
MIVGAGTRAFFDATDQERVEVFLPRFKQMVDEWENHLGARVVSSFVDDVLQMGETVAPFWAWYLTFEIDHVEVAAQMIQSSRQTVGGVRMDHWIRLEARIGRPFFAREEVEPQYVVDPKSGGYVPEKNASDLNA